MKNSPIIHGDYLEKIKNYNDETFDLIIADPPYNLDKDLILYGGLVLLGTCIPLHYEDADRQKRMMEIVSYEI